MLISEQFSKLDEYKSKLSALLLDVQSHGRLYKEKIDCLYNAITEPGLVNLGIKIDESRKEILKGILDDLNDSRRVWHYKANSDEFKFVVDLIKDVEIKILQEMQAVVQQWKDEVKLEIGSRFFACITDQEGYNNYKGLKSVLRELKVEEWKIKLDQKFEESRHKRLDIIAQEINSKYISKLIDKTSNEDNNQYKHKGHYVTLEEVLNRANPTREDKMLLLKCDIHQVKTFLEDQTLTELDKEALKEIQKDLQKEKDKSKKDFDSSDDWIQNLRETRDRYVENARKFVSAIPQSRMEGTYVYNQGRQR